jgi:hypothetical protein
MRLIISKRVRKTIGYLTNTSIGLLQIETLFMFGGKMISNQSGIPSLIYGVFKPLNLGSLIYILELHCLDLVPIMALAFI